MHHHSAGQHTIHRQTLPVFVNPRSKFPEFQLPTLIGYYSVDDKRKPTVDLSQMRYIYFPRDNENLGWDLSAGLDKVQRADESKNEEGLTHLLRALLAWGIPIRRDAAEFVCWRGLLTTIMQTPYEQNEGWEILASRCQNVIFMVAHETEEKKRRRLNQTDAEKRFQSWGYKFEQYMMSEKPNEPPVTSEPVKEAEEFCGVFRSKLNDHRLIFGAEMDGVKSATPISNDISQLSSAEFVELKTSRRIDNKRQERNFRRYKLLKWWAQSFLVGIRRIVCGFRDDQGIVDNLQFFALSEIPNMTRELWLPAVCMTFLSQFINFVSSTLEQSQDTDPDSVWRFRWEPGVHFVTVDHFTGKSDYSFLPEWFITASSAPLNRDSKSVVQSA